LRGVLHRRCIENQCLKTARDCEFFQTGKDRPAVTSALLIRVDTHSLDLASTLIQHKQRPHGDHATFDLADEELTTTCEIRSRDVIKISVPAFTQRPLDECAGMAERDLMKVADGSGIATSVSTNPQFGDPDGVASATFLATHQFVGIGVLAAVAR
jgi:hypothetical protein